MIKTSENSIVRLFSVNSWITGTCIVLYMLSRWYLILLFYLFAQSFRRFHLNKAFCTIHIPAASLWFDEICLKRVIDWAGRQMEVRQPLNVTPCPSQARVRVWARSKLWSPLKAEYITANNSDSTSRQAENKYQRIQRASLITIFFFLFENFHSRNVSL